MRLCNKLVLAALTIIAVLAMAVSGAAARSFQTSERNFEIAFDEAIGAPFTKYAFIFAGRQIQCRLTLLGTFSERIIRKETATTQGEIFHARVGTCTNGTAAVLAEKLPWAVRYRSFTGALPRITSVKIGVIRATFRVREAGGLECEFGTELNHPGVFIIGNSAEAPEREFEATGDPANVTAERSNRIPLGGAFTCAFAGEAEMGGIGQLTNLARTFFLRVTLI